MIPINTKQGLPAAATAYLVVVNSFIGVVLIVIGIYFLVTGSLPGTITANGITSTLALPPTWPGILLIVLGIAVPLYKMLWCKMFSFIVTDLAITIQTGVLVRQAKTIDLVRIQNADTVFGPLQMLFGVAQLNIWTASPGQFQISTTTVNGVPRTTSTPRPEGRLYLLKQDAEDMRTLLSNKGAIQNVNIASSNSIPVQ